MKKIRLVVIMIIIFIISGCNGGFFSEPIGKILNNPRSYEGKIVKISGTVSQSMNLIILKSFAVKDETGEIFVVTNRILPKQGDSVTVKGSVQEGFTIGNSQFIVIIEEGKK